MKYATKILLTTTLFTLYMSSVHAHLLAFNKLSPANKQAIVVTSFQLNKQQIIKEFHFRSKFFQVEKWMVSQKVVLADNHYYGAHAQAIQNMSQQKALQTGQAIEIDKEPPIHRLIDPMNKQTINGNNQENSTLNKINIAGFAAVSMCNAYASLHSSKKYTNLVPRFKAPLSLLQGMKPNNHHDSGYDLAQGVSFDCVYHSKKLKPISIKNKKALKMQHAPAKAKRG